VTHSKPNHTLIVEHFIEGLMFLSNNALHTHVHS